MTTDTNPTALSDDALAAMVSKIEALFRKAADPAATRPEAEAFQAKAVALMTKYRIAMVNIDVAVDENPESHFYDTIKGSYAPFHHNMITAVASAYGCRTFYYSSGRAGDPTRHVFIFGFKADANRVKQLAALFIQDAMQQAAKHKTTDPNTTIRWRKSFMAGYAAEIKQRFLEAQQLVEQEASTSTSNALVLVDRAKLVDQEFAKMKLSAGRGSATGSAEGYAAGRAAGRNSNVGRSSVGGSRTALGAG